MKNTMTKRAVAAVAVAYAEKELNLTSVRAEKLVVDLKVAGTFLVSLWADGLTFALLVVNGAVADETDTADFEAQEYKHGSVSLAPKPACGSGWTGDRCTKPEGHRGFHSNS